MCEERAGPKKERVSNVVRPVSARSCACSALAVTLPDVPASQAHEPSVCRLWEAMQCVFFSHVVYSPFDAGSTSVMWTCCLRALRALYEHGPTPYFRAVRGNTECEYAQPPAASASASVGQRAVDAANPVVMRLTEAVLVDGITATELVIKDAVRLCLMLAIVLKQKRKKAVMTGKIVELLRTSRLFG